MSGAARAAPSHAGGWRLPLWLDLLVTTAFVLLFARLIYLPQARPLGKDDALTAPAGQWLVLDGLTAGAILNLSTDAPGEVSFSAPSAAIDPASRTYLQSIGLVTGQGLGRLRWVAGATSAARLVVDLTVSQPGTRIALSVIPRTGVRLRVERGAVTVSPRLDSPTPPNSTSPAAPLVARGLLDAPGAGGPQDFGPGRPITFILTPSTASPDPALGFALAGPVSFTLLQDDGSEGSLPLTNAEIEADHAVLTRTCGGASGSIVFGPALFQPRARPIPALSMCEPGKMTIGELTLQPDAVVARPNGSAYVPGELPVWNTLKNNPAVGALLLAVIGYPAARLLGELRSLLKSPAEKPREEAETRP